MTVDAAPPSVFDADLPTLSYRDDETPAEIYPRLREAQRQAPVALGLAAARRLRRRDGGPAPAQSDR